ncbi:MAG: hypothetical protein ACLQVY_11350 [Limisphaerales bacterium]
MKPGLSKALSDTAWIENAQGERLKVELFKEGDELLGTVFIENVPYHVFFASRKKMGCGGEQFIVDRDPDYNPKQTASGRYLLIAPYAE